MESKGKRIYIANLTEVRGGTLMLSVLCSTLRELGYDARLLIREYSLHGDSKKTLRDNMKAYTSLYAFKRIVLLVLMRYGLLPKKFWNITTATIPGLKDKLKFKLLSPEKDSIIIYPEVIWGNPFGVRNVVRWLLYHHTFYEGEGTYGENDCFVAYRTVFNDERLNPEKFILNVNYFDANLYRRYNYGSRQGNCYILRKGKHRKDLPKKFDGPVFDGDISDEEFVKILNRCEYCYSYDTQTFYSSIASVCGCKSIVVPEPGKTASDYIAPGERHYGVAFGDTPEQIEYAESTRDLLIKNLDFAESNRANVKRFVEYLESKFGKIRRI